MALVPELPASIWYMIATVCTITFNIGMEVQSLPMSFRAMEVDLNVTAASLSWLFMYETVGFTLAVPFFLNIVESGMPRKQLLLIGTASWAGCTLMLALSRSYVLNVVLRFVAGISLAVVWPVTQASALEQTEASTRGFVFGLFFSAYSLGQVFSCLFFLPLSERLVAGFAGWRFALFTVAILRAVVVLAVKFFVREESPPVWRPERLGLTQEFQRIGNVLLIPTFGFLAFRCAVEYIGNPAGALTVVFFQYTGLDDQVCAYLTTLYMIGGGVGSLVGGIIGDKWYDYSPKYGRALTGQFSLLLALPLTYLIYSVDPARSSAAFFYGSLQFLNGFVLFTLTACVAPIIADVVQEFTYGLLIYNGFGIVVGLPVGNWLLNSMLHDRGYEVAAATVSEMDPLTRSVNLNALRIVIPMIQISVTIASIVGMCGLYITYHRDRMILNQEKETWRVVSDYGSTEEAGTQARQ